MFFVRKLSLQKVSAGFIFTFAGHYCADGNQNPAHMTITGTTPENDSEVAILNAMNFLLHSGINFTMDDN